MKKQLTTEDTKITENKQAISEAMCVIRWVRKHFVRLGFSSVFSVISVV
ncbi:MAG: hypothetical protein QMD17_14685 [Rhodocyclaceae bacterium]|nr:hypothetical protein [Rhodocyclaceae bacterium]